MPLTKTDEDFVDWLIVWSGGNLRENLEWVCYCDAAAMVAGGKVSVVVASAITEACARAREGEAGDDPYIHFFRSAPFFANWFVDAPMPRSDTFRTQFCQTVCAQLRKPFRCDYSMERLGAQFTYQSGKVYLFLRCKIDGDDERSGNERGLWSCFSRVAGKGIYSSFCKPADFKGIRIAVRGNDLAP